MTHRFVRFSIVLAALAGGCAMEGGAPSYEGGRHSAPPWSSGHPGADAGAGPSMSEESRERYEAVGTNPFVRTAHDPFSTFASDVDTASFDIFERDIAAGALPHPDGVRLEEYVNYFAYDYPTPPAHSEVPFDVHLALAPHPLGRDLALLRVAVQAEAAPAQVKRPTNLVFLVDVSGSMGSADKLPLAQTLMIAALGVLEPTDTVSIVAYASNTGVRLPPTPVAERARIEAAVRSLSAAGSTAGESGIRLAYAQAEAAFIEGGFNHVALMTDGDFNLGISSTDELVSLIEERRRTGVTLTALGFGRGNLNDAMMERVSNAGNGIYTVIVDADHARRYVEERLLSSVRHVAKDLKIQLELNPEHVVAYRLLGYENRALTTEQFRDDAVDAGEIGAGHRVTALYELVLPHQSIPADAMVREGEPVEGAREIAATDLVEVRVRYKALGASEEDPAFEIRAALTPADLAAAGADADLEWAAAIAAFAEILKGSPFGDVADLPNIAEIVHAQAGRDRDRARFAERFDATRALLMR
ncbi:MAG: von Willebrand factor type A domain-containing protein [Sandaracinaceae bacterium]|nr:von Willebrand factor type A domain-containing protein [Sandaracinaceae bacterium]